MPPDRRLDGRACQWVVMTLARGMLTIGIMLGALIILGGEIRWSSPTFEAALAYPYAPASWGWILGTVSLTGLTGSVFGHLKITAVALIALAVWSIFFGISFLQTAIHNPAAATTGIPLYLLGLPSAATLVALVHWRSNAIYK